MYAGSGRYEEAIKELGEAIRLNPGYAVARNNLGNIYALQNRLMEALREFNEVLRLDPEFPEAYQGIGSVYYSLGSYDKSASAWAQAVYFDPRLLECVPEKLLLKVRQGVSRLRGRT